MSPQRFARLAATTLSLTALAMGITAAKAPSAAKVEKLLAKGDTANAVAAAEASVEGTPSDAANRARLGRAYLQAGRFASAEAAFADALSIDPSDGDSALKLALVKVALGKGPSARDVLETNRNRIGGADYGLAVALSGDVPGAVGILEAVTRAPGADAKARQNLALAYALQGKWVNARVMAVQDLSPAEADARIINWMNFVRPAATHDQVASLLGVTPAAVDTGQPVALAFARDTAPVTLAEVSTTVETIQAPPPPPVLLADAAPPAVVVETASGGPSTAELATAFAETRRVMFAATKEVVQQVPAAVFSKAPQILTAKPAKLAPIRAVSGGRYVVQLGAFGSDASAERAWKQGSKRLGVAGYTPSSARVRLHNVSFVRLSVGGFEQRRPAVQLCERVRTVGGRCFVRVSAGDQIASWVRPDAQRFAAR